MLKFPGYLYFGCGPDSIGHYLYDKDGRRFTRHPWDRSLNFDGTLAPQPEEKLYVGTVNRLPGWNMTAVAWWDRSGDKRGASNSVFFAPLCIAESVIVEYFEHLIPWAAKRMPQRLTLLDADPREARSCERCGKFWAGRFPQTVCPTCASAARDERTSQTAPE